MSDVLPQDLPDVQPIQTRNWPKGNEGMLAMQYALAPHTLSPRSRLLAAVQDACRREGKRPEACPAISIELPTDDLSVAVIRNACSTCVLKTACLAAEGKIPFLQIKEVKVPDAA